MHPLAAPTLVRTITADPLPVVHPLVPALQDLLEAVESDPHVPTWLVSVRDQLVALQVAVHDHVRSTEGARGTYATFAHAAPRLTFRVDRLAREHSALLSRVASLRALAGSPGVEPVMLAQPVRVLVEDLRAHRSRGVDLLFESEQRDIGGEE